MSHTIRNYRYWSIWIDRKVKSKCRATLEEIEKQGGTQILDDFVDIIISDDPESLSTSAFLRNGTGFKD